MRTVFTEAQSRQLEALFQVTDYPTAEARAELSARTGLTEETIRVSSLSFLGFSPESEPKQEFC